MPHPSLDSFFFWNSGSEAVEAAIKMARAITRRQNIITMQGMFRSCFRCHSHHSAYLSGAYHGRTYAAMAVTKSKTIYSEGCAPLMVRLQICTQKPNAFIFKFAAWRLRYTLSILASACCLANHKRRRTRCKVPSSARSSAGTTHGSE
jgi:4-aminobutyrate aminotransferase-like enzyme